MNEDLVAYEEAAELLRGLQDRETGSGASAQDIARVVAAFGPPVFSSYTEFLREFGWGGAADLEILGAGPDTPPFLDVTIVLERERNELQPSLSRSLLPIQRDGAGGLFCLRDRGDGMICDVVFWDHERDSQQIPESLAPNFGTWLMTQVRALESGLD